MSIPSFAGKLADNVRTLTGQLTENLHAVQRMIGQCEDAHRRVIDCTQQITCSFESKLDAVLAALASIRGGEAVRPTTRDGASASPAGALMLDGWTTDQGVFGGHGLSDSIGAENAREVK